MAMRMYRAATHPVEHPGSSSPLGATLCGGGVNFSIFSRTASRIELLLFDRAEDSRPSRTIQIDPTLCRTYHYWHSFIPNLQAGQLYGYRVHGPHAPSEGHRFDPSKLLLDPYARGVAVPPNYSREAASKQGDNAGSAMKSVIVDPSAYDWEGDTPLRHPSARTVIYEMHVRGFTRHPSSGVSPASRGTYAGVIEKIPYLARLGITAVELMPVFQFDPQDAPPGHVNYWGYSPVTFFAPHCAYSSLQTASGPVDEFRDMVKALHKARIEVILDVVYNHTAEGDERGPTLSLRGLENSVYYTLARDRARYCNYTGTGNTLNANNPVVRRMILDSLRYWVEHMHVDGFRFDLASILSRDGDGHVMANPPSLWDIETDPILAGTKIIAEAWDAAGLYQLGSFIGDSWKEWNGRFRDEVRAFFRGDGDTVGNFADRFIGSPDIYGHQEREAEQSVNFISCHDGFTLNDLVSYNEKHNEANGEEGRDGANDNRSWNCGVEGPTNDSAIESLRNRQIKNFLTTTVLSLGVPMIQMGDEVRRTQHGNNNAYALDNELNWFDWTLIEKHADIHRFLTLLVERRLLRDVLPEERRMSLNQLLQKGKAIWHGTRLNQPDWSSWSHSVAFCPELTSEQLRFYFIWNAYHEALDFELPEAGAGGWRRWIDTFLNPPEDIVAWQAAQPVGNTRYQAGPRSVVALYTRLKDGQ